MNHYTPEYKDAVHKIGKLYNDGVISYNTFELAIQDVSRVMGVDVTTISNDISTLYDVWSEYEVVG